MKWYIFRGGVLLVLLPTVWRVWLSVCSTPHSHAGGSASTLAQLVRGLDELMLKSVMSKIKVI